MYKPNLMFNDTKSEAFPWTLSVASLRVLILHYVNAECNSKNPEKLFVQKLANKSPRNRPHNSITSVAFFIHLAKE
jgi:hypothetical protein